MIWIEANNKIECDAVIACTGWKNWFPMFDVELARKLGLPLLPIDSDEDENATWEKRIGRADVEVVAAFPRLLSQLRYPDHAPKSTPSRLFRGMIPVSGDADRSIVFLGNVGTTQSFTVGEVQALWAASYLDGTLPLPATEEMKHQVALATAWRRRRYLGDGYTFILEQLQVVFHGVRIDYVTEANSLPVYIDVA
jgi:dimethylaniline monooxygenase (N-oxide forming)